MFLTFPTSRNRYHPLLEWCVEGSSVTLKKLLLLSYRDNYDFYENCENCVNGTEEIRFLNENNDDNNKSNKWTIKAIKIIIITKNNTNNNESNNLFIWIWKLDDFFEVYYQ